MRPFCLHCTIKHLGQAYAHHSEVHTGYPRHILGIVGHLAEAAEECIGASPELAADIRAARLAILDGSVGMYFDGKDVQVPYLDLFHKAMLVLKEKGCGNCQGAGERLKAMIQERKGGAKAS